MLYGHHLQGWMFKVHCPLDGEAKPQFLLDDRLHTNHEILEGIFKLCS